MAPRTSKSTFKGCEGFPTIKQDGRAFQRCILVGALLADRELFRAGRPGMGIDDYDTIKDDNERSEYKQAVNTLKNTLRFPLTQEKNLKEFWSKYGLDDSWNSEKNLEAIQERLDGHYRLILFNYHNKSGMVTLNRAGEEVNAKNICLITDGVKWDVMSKMNGLYEGRHFCRGCLKTSTKITNHRCEYSCSSCNSLLAPGNCNGHLNRQCTECNFFFQTEKCYLVHKHEPRKGFGSRCDTIKYCFTCRSVYKARRVPHCCFDNIIYCTMCTEHVKNDHECTWAPVTDRQRAKYIKEQEEWRAAYYDIETSQADEDEHGELVFREHYATAIVLIKACYLCWDAPIADYCENCHVREARFMYDPNETEYDKNKVMHQFLNYVISDATITNLYAHNGGRFDTHLVIDGMLRMGIPPSMINKGTNVIRALFTLRGGRRIILKDSYSIIPMALGQFNKAFELDCEEKGDFPHLANSRKHWGKKWPSIPDRRYYGYKYKTPEAQKKFDQWYESQIGKEWDQDKMLIDYCRSDVIILMQGCIKFQQIMIEETGWSPFIVANTLPSFCQFVLRANHINAQDFHYLPEAGYGAVNQSDVAIRFFKWLEHKHPERTYQHAHTPLGEKVVCVNSKRFSVDCLEDDKKIIELLGCWYHGCPRCYRSDDRLVGGETARELLNRTEYRLNMLRLRYEVEAKWECDLRDEIAGDREMKKFFDNVEVIERLRPRDGLYGGRVEVFRPYLKATEHVEIKYYDIVSMYPYVQSMMPFPIGRPTIIKSGFLPITGNKLPYRGLIKLRVLPPRSLRISILPIQHDKYLYFGNCFNCIRERTESCNHENELDRCWVGTYCTEEVEKALEYGYRILDIFEVWAWERFDDKVYRNYFKQCMRMKFAASGFPSDVTTDEQKTEYCKRVGAKLGFKLDPKDVTPSAARRYVAKLMANSAWGKLAEVPTHSKTEYASRDGLLSLMLDPTRHVSDVRNVDHELVLVTHRPVKETIRANRFSSVPHAAYVTCYARLFLYQVIDAVNGTVAYCDTDSVVFTMPRGGIDPLAHLLTGEFGDLSDEMEEGWEIEEAVFAGCKNYTMLMKNKTTGETKVKQALRGFTKDANTLETLCHKNIRTMVLEKDDPNTPEFLDVTRPELKRTMGHVNTEVRTKKYRPVSMKRATRGAGEEEFKVPFGYVDSD